MSLIQSVVNYVTACPLLSEGYMRVDNLGPDPVEYGIAVLPGSPIVKKYIDGSSIRQYLFAVTSREYYSIDMLANIANSEFYEDLADWFEEQNAAKSFPDFGTGKTVQRIELVTSGYLYSTDRKTARYQLEVRIIYHKEATNERNSNSAS
mgnify:CR=1 FL=1